MILVHYAKITVSDMSLTCVTYMINLNSKIESGGVQLDIFGKNLVIFHNFDLKMTCEMHNSLSQLKQALYTALLPNKCISLNIQIISEKVVPDQT